MVQFIYLFFKTFFSLGACLVIIFGDGNNGVPVKVVAEMLSRVKRYSLLPVKMLLPFKYDRQPSDFWAGFLCCFLFFHKHIDTYLVSAFVLFFLYMQLFSFI